MIGGTGNILSPALSKQLVALQSTARQVDATQLKLATGKRVNSALDNPQNFFQSLSLQNQASDLGRLLDGISQSIRTIQETENGLNGLEKAIELAEFTARNAQETLLAEQENISEVILEDDPLVYFALDETEGNIVNNQGTESGSILGQYQGGVEQDTGTLHFSKDSGSVTFDGVNDYINIPNSALINTSPAGYTKRTVEMTFNADEVQSRQVLFKEGGTGNAFNIYIDSGSVYVEARDAGDFGPFNISKEIEAGETYHVAFVFDSDAARFTGYVNGEAIGSGAVTKEMNRHGGAISIGRSSGGAYYHDGPQGGTNNYFAGKISDFALYNDSLSSEKIASRYDVTQLGKAAGYQKEIESILSQFDGLTEDASYRGINLLKGDNLITDFDKGNKSHLETEGRDLTRSGVGIAPMEFQTFEALENSIKQIDGAVDELREFSRTLASDINIIQTREDYTQKTINTLNSGSDDLVLADQNAEGARLLALSTRQEIQFQTLALSAQGSNIADLLQQSSVGGSL